MKLGSLFDGIGGFPLSGTRHGFEPVWASEIEPFPVKVTQRHFPGMKHLGDITKINGAEIEPVEAISFGSPCTRLSVAGKHDGFDITFKCEGEEDDTHEIYKNTVRATDKYQYIYKDTCRICGKELFTTNDSALFFHAIRIIREMRDATNGQYPRFAVWENVPGAYSSNRGQDFRAVLAEFSDTEIPMPLSGGWADAGLVRTNRVEIAWRTLDAQYWGVPQRRKRIFLVADFRGQCAGEILFVEDGLRGDFTESRETRKEIAATVGDGVEEPSSIKPIGFSGKNSASLNLCPSEELSPTLRAGAETHVAVYGFDSYNQTALIEVINALRSASGGDTKPMVAIIPFNTGQITSPQNGNNPKPGDPCHTLGATGAGRAICIQGSMIGGADKNGPQGDGINEDVSFALNTAQGGQRQPCVMAVGYQESPGYAVRRLTPLECERLQGFPDNWTGIEGASDTARYKALGNSVAIPCVDFIMGGIAHTPPI